MMLGENVFMLYIKHKEECFIRYPNTEKWVEKNEAQPVFYIASQSINNS